MSKLLINKNKISVVDTSTKHFKRLEKQVDKEYKLTSGIVLAHAGHLDCGGTQSYEELGKLVKKHGTKDSYSRGFEWCAGLGAFGFHLLGLEIAKHMVFNDYYDYAVKMCLKTAKNNNVSNKITGYTTHSISTISNYEKWDLVVGNPPHCWNTTIDSALDDAGKTMFNEPNLERLLLDLDMQTHLDFFKNIKNYITRDADIFIVACDLNPVEKFASLGNLKVHQIIKMDSNNLWSLVHYKPI